MEFLDVFGGCLSEDRWRERPLPTIHCYTFARAAESDAGERQLFLDLENLISYPTVIHSCHLQCICCRQHIYRNAGHGEG